jgi:hypothetical protein
MGQLTNLYVSQSYQGLLKMTDSTNGLTNTLQTVQTGDGDNSPLQMSLTEVNISGSLTVNGQPISVDSGSFVTTSSFNAYTSSVNTKLAGLDVETGSLQSQINQKLNTSSFNSYTSSNDTIVNSLVNATGSYATTSSLTALSQSIATTDLAQDNRLNSIESITGSLATTSSLTSLSQSIATTDLGQDNRLGSLESKTSSYATTGSNDFVGQQNINGSVNVTGSLNVTGEITALSASITYLETIFQTSSVLFSSGSNILGDEASDTQTLFGTVRLPNGPLSVTGSVTATNFTGSLEGTASYATQALSASYAPDTTNTGSFMITGSVSGATSTFTKGDGSTFNLTVNNVQSASYADIAGSAGTTDSALRTSVTAKNVSGVTILKGTPCYITGSGTGGNLVGVFPADAGNPLRMPAGVVLNETLNAGDEGEAIVVGFINGVDTSAFGSGDSVYVAVGGGYTNVKPTGSALIQKLGNVEKSAVNGSGVISGPGRANDVPNIQTGHFWVGNTDQVATPVSTGSFATTGSNTFIGDQTITGSLNVSGRSSLEGPLSSTDGLIKLYSTASLGGTVQPGQFLTASAPVSQSNIVFASIASATGQGPLLPGQTGSIQISGSNNILLSSNRSNFPLGNVGYIGSSNIVNIIPTLNTSSFYRPGVNNNLLYGGIVMTMGSGSGVPSISQNVQFGNTTFNVPLTTGGTMNYSQNFLVGTINYQQPSSSLGYNIIGNNIAGTVTLQGAIPYTGTAINGLSQNIVNGSIFAQNNSGSFSATSNTINGANIFVTSSYKSTAAASNAVIFNNNTINGVNHRFLFDGTGTGTRTFANNLIGGTLFTGSLVANNNEGIGSFMAYGRGLYAEGGLPGGADTAGSTFLGRWNETGSLSNPAQYRFVIGNGTDAANRRTSLALDGATNTFVFNSNINQTGSLTVSGSAADHRIIGARLFLSASLNASSSFDHTIVGNQINVTGNTLMSGNGEFPLTVYGTINSKRLHFNTNPFNSNPSSNLGAIRLDGLNQTFYSTNYDTAQITTQSQVFQTVITGSGLVQTGLQSNNMGSDYSLTLKNQSGTGSLITNANFRLQNNNGTVLIRSNEFNSGSQYAQYGVIADVDNPGGVYSGYVLWTPTGYTSENSEGSMVINSYTPEYPSTPTFMFVGGGNNPAGSDTAIAFPANGEFDVWKKSNFKYPMSITGSLGVSGGITGSLQGTASFATNALSASYAPVTLPSGLVSGSSQISYTGITDVPSGIVSGSSQISALGFAITGSNTFNGNQTITGSLTVTGSAVITGSVQGNVLPLTVTSNTASLNLNDGNFFELALTGSQNIRIEPSNIKPGQTINVKLNTTGSGTVSFPTSVKQVSGSAYVPSTGTTTDIITLVSFDSSNLFLANVKNFI